MKKVLSLVLSLVMAVTSLTMATAVFAEDAKTAKVFVSAQIGGAFVATPTELTVSSDLSDKYSAEVGYNDSQSEPTILDAAIAAHIAFMGEDFMTFAPLSVSTEGWINDFFGNGSAMLYFQNNAMASVLTQTVADGDYVDFDMYTDTADWTDMYVYANVPTAAVHTTDSLELTFTTNMWGTLLPTAGLSVKVGDEVVGTTDDNGKIKLSFSKMGTYFVSSENTIGTTPVFMPYCTVTVTNEVVDYVNKQEAAAAKYLYFPQESFSVEASYDFVTLIRSGYDVSEYADRYALSVKNNLDANDGKLITNASGTEKEDIGLYGAVIIALKALGYDTTDFYSYNLEKALNNADIEAASTHQYHYKYAIEAASSDKAKAIINDLIAKYYTLGSGMDNWGFSCDNTCHFLISIAPYASDYEAYVNDAKALIKTYLKDKGAYCDDMWSPDSNADSTALSMAAFASIGDAEEAFNYYKLLIENFETDDVGIFSFVVGGTANSYATNDALFSHYYFKKALYAKNFNKHAFILDSTTPATCAAAGREVYKCRFCNIEQVKDLQKLNHTTVKDKAVAPTFKKAGKTAGSHCSVCGAVIKKQKKVAKLGAAKLSSLVKDKKAFTAKWGKVAGVDGYQIQYSLKKNMKSSKKKNVKGAKATKKKIVNLKEKKTYYVRIRAYKKINCKRQYSEWSAIKKVTVK